jgi:hypothetical protein
MEGERVSWVPEAACLLLLRRLRRQCVPFACFLPQQKPPSSPGSPLPVDHHHHRSHGRGLLHPVSCQLPGCAFLKLRRGGQRCRSFLHGCLPGASAPPPSACPVQRLHASLQPARPPFHPPGFPDLLEAGQTLQIGRYLATGTEGTSLYADVRHCSAERHDTTAAWPAFCTAPARPLAAKEGRSEPSTKPSRSWKPTPPPPFCPPNPGSGGGGGGERGDLRGLQLRHTGRPAERDGVPH